jgi:N-acetylglucosamine kinase-like BadF-type ATPase
MAVSRPGCLCVAGVDVGGTWVRVVVLDGERERQVRRPAARVPELGSLLRTLCGPGTRLAALVVASRGIWTTRERRALERRLAGVAGRVRVLSDAEAALRGALGDRAGVVVLAGTGAIALGRDTRHRVARAGGLGPLLGDDGSAFWIGREWLRVAARDGDIARARRLVRGPDPVGAIAALAPRVLACARRGDRRALTIACAAQSSLATLALDVARRLGLSAPIDASWAGGLMDDVWFRAGVRRAVARAGLRARWREPESEPVLAAARLAARLAGSRAAGVTAEPSLRRRVAADVDPDAPHQPRPEGPDAPSPATNRRRAP